MRQTIDRISQSVGTASVELLDLADRLRDRPAGTIRQAAELLDDAAEMLDQAAEILTQLHLETAARPRARAAPSVPPPCTCGPPGMASAPATVAPLDADARGQGLLWADMAA